MREFVISIYKRGIPGRFVKTGPLTLEKMDLTLIETVKGLQIRNSLRQAM